MSYSISLNINLKNNNNHSETENLLIDCGNNLYASNIYNDYELEGINNFIKKNNKIILFEFEELNNLIDFIILLKDLKKNQNHKFYIEYIYYINNILYANNKYLNNLNPNLISKKDLLEKIEINKANPIFSSIYKNL
tara:strand:- start:70 stop:480 length:411 start_codon:yes stop_codon:yes gene_type:complete